MSASSADSSIDASPKTSHSSVCTCHRRAAAGCHRSPACSNRSAMSISSASSSWSSSVVVSSNSRDEMRETLSSSRRMTSVSAMSDALVRLARRSSVKPRAMVTGVRSRWDASRRKLPSFCRCRSCSAAKRRTCASAVSRRLACRMLARKTAAMRGTSVNSAGSRPSVATENSRLLAVIVQTTASTTRVRFAVHVR